MYNSKNQGWKCSWSHNKSGKLWVEKVEQCMNVSRMPLWIIVHHSLPEVCYSSRCTELGLYSSFHPFLSPFMASEAIVYTDPNTDTSWNIIGEISQWKTDGNLGKESFKGLTNSLTSPEKWVLWKLEKEKRRIERQRGRWREKEFITLLWCLKHLCFFTLGLTCPMVTWLVCLQWLLQTFIDAP